MRVQKYLFLRDNISLFNLIKFRYYHLLLEVFTQCVRASGEFPHRELIQHFGVRKGKAPFLKKMLSF